MLRKYLEKLETNLVFSPTLNVNCSASVSVQKKEEKGEGTDSAHTASHVQETHHDSPFYSPPTTVIFVQPEIQDRSHSWTDHIHITKSEFLDRLLFKSVNSGST